MIAVFLISKVNIVLVFLSCSCFFASKSKSNMENVVTSSLFKDFGSRNPTNILLILADDLGYGDTSVFPFIGSGIRTPELEKMAARGTILTNFHTAAATCTPTRASILTGLYPWRLGIKAVFEYGEKFKSNRDDWLPLVPTTASVFSAARYKTGHSGKWHLGGMRNDDYDLRIQGTGDIQNQLGARCPHPGPNQQGFEEYVSVLDGPGSPRQNELQVESTLYSKGCSALLRNDVAIGRSGGPLGEYLSDCEARHAIRMMNESVRLKVPFYIHLWFHAPHGPWERIPGFESVYGSRKGDRGDERMDKYRTMVSAMDKSIGNVLHAVRALGVEKDTLIVFTSDNGPEDFVGTTSGFTGNKRHLTEGGIRVPCIFQWVGTIPKGRNSSAFGVSTDLFPTFLQASNISPPKNVILDGISLLPELVPAIKIQKSSSRRLNSDRVVFWHSDYEGPRASAAWSHDFKLLLDEKDYPRALYDMRRDPYEKKNLLDALRGPAATRSSISSILSNSEITATFNQIGRLDNNSIGSFRGGGSGVGGTLLRMLNDRSNTALHRLVLSKLFPLLSKFVMHGDEALHLYMQENKSRMYTPSPESDMRRFGVGNINSKAARRINLGELRSKLINEFTCDTPCGCATIPLMNISAFPFARVVVGGSTLSNTHEGVSGTKAISNTGPGGLGRIQIQPGRVPTLTSLIVADII